MIGKPVKSFVVLTPLAMMISVLLMVILPSNAYAAISDYNGDGLSDVAVFYGYPNMQSGIHVLRSGGSTLENHQGWKSAPACWDWSKSKVVSGDFDGDGKADMAVLYDYGEGTSKIYTFKSDGTNFTNIVTWENPPGTWDASRSSIAAGDFDGDGKTDLVVMYDYGAATTRIFMFKSDGTNFTHSIAWANPPGSWDASRSKLTSGDFDDDGKSDLAILYDYGAATSKIFLLKSDGANFTHTIAWENPAGTWEASRSALTSGDYNGDGKTDLAIMYDYGLAAARVFLFTSDGTDFSHSVAWAVGQGTWDATRSKIASGDFDGDNLDDLSVFYQYDSIQSGAYIFKSDGASFSNRLAWMSPVGCWDWLQSKIATQNGGSGRYGAWLSRDYQIGTSVQGRPIMATRIGSGTRRFLFIGAHHGNEPQGGRVLERFREYLLTHPEAVPADVEVWIVPYMNPDGVAAGTRWNARGVNINRNYGTLDWGQYGVTTLAAAQLAGLAPLTDSSTVITGTPYTFGYPGPTPFSEPETVAIANLCYGTSFKAMITIHDSEACVYWGTSGSELAVLFGSKAGLPAAGSINVSGDATRWFGEATWNPSITVEMTEADTQTDPGVVFGGYLPALLGTINY